MILGAPGTSPGEGNRYALDPTDGLPRLQERVFRENGQTFKVSMSEQYGVYSGNVLFPTMRAELTIQDDLVAGVMMTILEKAEFNLALEDQAFSMSVPQGWAWFDMRTASHPGGVFGQPVADVVAFFERDLSTGRREGLSAGSHSESPGGFGAWIPIVLILNGLVLIGFGVVLFRSPG